MHEEVKKYLSERNSKAAKARWTNTTPEERKAVSKKLNEIKRKKLSPES
jgi:acyl-CoA reductase-like NAD-dependent aldehyde dehydrogenase